MDKIAELARERARLEACGDRNGLIELAAKYSALGMTATAAEVMRSA
jgi:hypothetical protein